MKPFTDSLLIIIVIYKQKLETCVSFQSILAMTKIYGELELFVYDNSPAPQEIKCFKNLKITYINDLKNSGVSKAYNSGVAYANTINKEYVLLLDQDTQLPTTILKGYYQAVNDNSEVNLFVPILKLKNSKIFSPSRYRFKRGFFLDEIEPGIHSLFKLAPVNSGMLLKIEAFLKVGGYNEKVKLDFADFQFVERLRKSYDVFSVIDFECEQDFSDENVSIESQEIRYMFYCEGAKNIENKSFLDWFQYNAVVLLRGVSLFKRFGKMSFINIYLKNFLFASRS